LPVGAKTTAILHYLGGKHGYTPVDPAQAVRCLQYACDAADVWAEAYQARRGGDKGEEFKGARLTAWLQLLERCLATTPGK